MGGMTAVMDRPGYARLLLVRNRPGDAARAVAILAEVRRDMARLGIRRNWQLTALEELGLLTDAPRRGGGGRRIAAKPSRNRQDSGSD